MLNLDPVRGWTARGLKEAHATERDDPKWSAGSSVHEDPRPNPLYLRPSALPRYGSLVFRLCLGRYLVFPPPLNLDCFAIIPRAHLILDDMVGETKVFLTFCPLLDPPFRPLAWTFVFYERWLFLGRHTVLGLWGTRRERMGKGV